MMAIRFRTAAMAAMVTLCFTPQPVVAQPDAGAYLAARQADSGHDFGAAARYFSQSLRADPGNADLLKDALTSLMGQGDVDGAIALTRDLRAQGHDSQIAHLIWLLAAAKTGDWQAVLDAQAAGHSIGPLVDHVTRSWAYMGQGHLARAMAAFDAMIAADGMAIYGATHKAYALASIGDFAGAEAVLSGPVPGGMRYSRSSAVAHAQILAKLDRRDQALDLIDRVFGDQLDRGMAQFRARLLQGDPIPYDAVTTPAQGLADLFHVIAGVLRDEAPKTFTLIYARAGSYLRPGHTPAMLMTADLLEELENYRLAGHVYAAVPQDDPAFHAAELGRADVLQAAGRTDAAIAVLEALSQTHPNLPEVYANKGDTLRRAQRYAEAIVTYSRALALYGPDSSARWFVHYTRGTAYHKTGNWPGAEADFRAALALRPDHPQVLNYLGYSLVERGEKLSEALDMIERAAAGQPENGAIIDSLGWVYFKLGRYGDAVAQLERAATLEPVDPVINDHLGDAFWAVGRETEARFQWRRALSLDPVDGDRARIRAKLQQGLKIVHHSEGHAPIRMASGDD